MQIKITLQPEIYKKLKENSKANMRTLSAEVNFVLKKAYDIVDIETDTIPKPKRDGDLW